MKNEEKMLVLSLDVESDGLYGPPIAVGCKVFECDINGHEFKLLPVQKDDSNSINQIYSFEAQVKEPDIKDNWVRENIIEKDRFNGITKINNLDAIIDNFKNFIDDIKNQQSQYKHIVLLLDTCFPVEMNFLKLLDEEEVDYANFKVIDIATLLYVIGYNSNVSKAAIINELKNNCNIEYKSDESKDSFANIIDSICKNDKSHDPRYDAEISFYTFYLYYQTIKNNRKFIIDKWQKNDTNKYILEFNDNKNELICKCTGTSFTNKVYDCRKDKDRVSIQNILYTVEKKYAIEVKSYQDAKELLKFHNELPTYLEKKNGPYPLLIQECITNFTQDILNCEFSGHNFVMFFNWDILRNDMTPQDKYKMKFSERTSLSSFSELLTDKWELDKFVDENVIKKHLHEKIYKQNFNNDNQNENCDDEKEEFCKTNTIYKDYNFFFPNARDLIFNSVKNKEEIASQEPITSIYSYKELNGINKHKSEYIIENIQGNKTYYYILNLEKIELRIYKSGIGLLSFYTKNFITPHLSDICRINDWGRRVFTPFYLFKDNNSYTPDIVADKLQISIKNEEKEISSLYLIESAQEADCFKTEENVKKFLFNEETLRKKNLCIFLSFEDDRMFTASYYIDQQFSDDLKNSFKSSYEWDKSTNIDNLYDYNSNIKDSKSFDKLSINKKWYAFCFIDPDYYYPTCQDNEMMLSLLKKHTYKRWSEYGTFYGISQYSLVMLVNYFVYSDAGRYIKDNFSSQYMNFVYIALFRKSSISRFKDEIANLEAYQLNDKNTKSELYKDILKVYNTCTVHIFDNNISPQEQAIEMTDMLNEKIKIFKDISDLDRIIHQAYSHIQNEVEEKKNNEEKRFQKKVTVVMLLFSTLSGFAFILSFISFAKDIILFKNPKSLLFTYTEHRFIQINDLVPQCFKHLVMNVFPGIALLTLVIIIFMPFYLFNSNISEYVKKFIRWFKESF